MKNTCFIPARYESTRLPGKPLLKIKGISVINRVYLQVKKCKMIDEIIVLTDDIRIKKEVESINGRVEMITEECLNGTERIIKYLQNHPESCDIVVNVQGDEPFVNPEDIDRCIQNYYKIRYNQYNNEITNNYNHNVDYKCSTMCHLLKLDEVENRNKGKVILNKKNDILYCSRNVIPGSKNDILNKDYLYYGHTGVFVFDKNYLLNEFIKENTQYQIYEDIEWLKIIEQGYKINTIFINNPERGIDTIEDYNYFLQKYN
jgi:3-deoxy-manno-octulosonate cytidylyltransferase (CMP-KDO synthetase)